MWIESVVGIMCCTQNQWGATSTTNKISRRCHLPCIELATAPSSMNRTSGGEPFAAHTQYQVLSIAWFTDNSSVRTISIVTENFTVIFSPSVKIIYYEKKEKRKEYCSSPMLISFVHSSIKLLSENIMDHFLFSHCFIKAKQQVTYVISIHSLSFTSKHWVHSIQWWKMGFKLLNTHLLLNMNPQRL